MSDTPTLFDNTGNTASLLPPIVPRLTPAPTSTALAPTLPTSLAALVPPAPSPSRRAPLYANLPAATEQLRAKYDRLGPSLSALPTPIVRSLVQYDAERALRGAPPLTTHETALAVRAAVTGQAATPPPDRNPLAILGNAVSDLRGIVTSIPRIPLALVNEVRELPHIADTCRRSTRPWRQPDRCSRVHARCPSAARRCTSSATSLVAGGGCARPCRTPGKHRPRRAPRSRPVPRRPHRLVAPRPQPAPVPSPRSLTRTLDEAGTLTPNRVGRAAQAVARTQPGQAIGAVFGRDARMTARLANTADATLREALNPAAPARRPTRSPTWPAGHVNCTSTTATSTRPAALN